jgi:hypothetical protein
MTHESADDEGRALRYFLDCQRAAVLATVEGFTPDAWHRPIVPRGWTPAGLVAHLGGAERHWFQEVVRGRDEEPPNVRWVVLHMIEETACHSGHLDIAPTLADGRTDLGHR